MTQMSEPAVLYETSGAGMTPHVAVVTINRPHARNAIDGAVARALDDIVKRTEADPDIWTVLLTSAGGKAFSAGADLKAVAAGEGDSIATPDGGFAGFTSALRSKPWIAAVEGYALGGGCEIALACDLIVAARDASFGLPEVRRGLIAAAGGLYRLPRVLPPRRALELIMTGAPVEAAEMHRLGVVSRLAEPGDALGQALVLAAGINASAPLAVRESLGIARRAISRDEAEMQALSDEAIARVAQSEDFRTGVRAFVNKQAPEWNAR